jgi:hypothetical protein
VASESAYAPLPDRSTWRFDRISIEDPDRASALELLGTSEQLLDAVAAAFEHAVLNGRVRFGREHAEDARGGCRAVIQFHVRAALFDWFFNGRSGYRAHFWADPLDGIAFNDQMVSLCSQFTGSAKESDAKSQTRVWLFDRKPHVTGRDVRP